MAADMFFEFLGKNSLEDFGVYLTKEPKDTIPEKNVTETEVPGRDGSFIEDDGTYKSYLLPLECAILGNDVEDMRTKMAAVKAWLSGGMGDLILSSKPDEVITAIYKDPCDIEQECEVFGEFELIFLCQPYKHAITGATTTYNSFPATINNGKSYSCKPVITLIGSGAGTLTVNGKDIAISAIDQQVTVDSDMQETYKKVIDGTSTTFENKNATKTGDYPILNSGNNTISVSGGITSIIVDKNERWL